MSYFLSHCENLIKGLVTCVSKHCLNKAGIFLPHARYKPKLENPPPTPNPHMAHSPLTKPGLQVCLTDLQWLSAHNKFI